jgi:hypothetical protein
MLYVVAAVVVVHVVRLCLFGFKGLNILNTKWAKIYNI